MTKILLVEDDKSLREIYGVRLQAEGYDIISAGDGEQALAMAVKERPNLVISDVMMPKISGFDMLDILRSTPETREIKVIMMTALSSEDQRARGESLGANRYLVKSQVGIEDVVRTVHDVLADSPVPTKVAVPDFGAPVAATVSAMPNPVNVPSRPFTAPIAPAEPRQDQAPAAAVEVAPETAPIAAPVEEAPAPVVPIAPVAAPTYSPTPIVTTPEAAFVNPTPIVDTMPVQPVSTPQPQIQRPAEPYFAIPVITPAAATTPEAAQPVIPAAPVAPESPVAMPSKPVIIPVVDAAQPAVGTPVAEVASQPTAEPLAAPVTTAAPNVDISALINQELNSQQ